MTRACSDPDGTLVIGYRLERNQLGDWGWLEDKGEVAVQRQLPKGRWHTVVSSSGGEAVRRVTPAAAQLDAHALWRLAFKGTIHSSAFPAGINCGTEATP
jgi:hypothetical protein